MFKVNDKDTRIPTGIYFANDHSYLIAKFQVSLKYGFGIIVESSVKRRVNLPKCHSSKMYNFCSSRSIYLKFSPDNTHQKLFE